MEKRDRVAKKSSKIHKGNFYPRFSSKKEVYANDKKKLIKSITFLVEKFC